jgi:hypothetical protein
MTLFFNREQAADLLGISVDEVEDLLERGELSRTPDGIPADEVALLIQERELAEQG